VTFNPRRLATLVAVGVLAAGLTAFPKHLISRTAVSNDFVHFESAHVHPAALTPNGARLLVVNTPDNRLSVFDVTGPQPVRIAEIPVGLEPVSVAALDNGIAWVVNNLSDDVSIVDLTTMHVTATLAVGDEPNDVVFAGSPRRGYVSVSQEDRIRVYDPTNLAAAPVNIPIDGRYPRSLAANAAGTSVYAAVFFAGNRTSVLGFEEVPPDSQPVDPQFPRSPQLIADHGPGPRVGLIVQQVGNDWRDMYGKLWNHRVKYTQSDVDVAEISAASASVTRTFDGLGAVIYAIAVGPTDGRVAAASTEARNLLRFEPRIKGHIVDTQMGFVTAAGAKSVANLNPHVNYAGPGTQAERDSALGIPTGVAFAGNGQRVYVTSLASDRLGVVDPATGAVIARAPTVAGPTGVVVDDAHGRIYVVGRYHNELQTLSSANLQQVARTGIGFDPTPDEIVNGRKFFYGGFTSAHGEQACASCHLFGDLDNLAWDLGDPAGQFHGAPPNMDDPFLTGSDPMKGPMTTQSLRGLPNTGLLHWRGDRDNLAAFNPAFVSLMGRSTQLPDSEMAAFNDFVSALVYPPNPAQHLDRTMPDAPVGQPSAARGGILFKNTVISNDHTCDFCHSAPAGTSRQVISAATLLAQQDMKVPQLRNLYKKTGFTDQPGAVNKRGFGFTHDGSFGSVFDFLHRPIFNFDGDEQGDLDRRDIEAFVLAFDTGTAPAVGRQITFDASNKTDATLAARLDTLRARAAAGDCDLIARGRLAGQPRGWWYQSDGTWRPDKQAQSAISSVALVNLAGSGSEITVTGVPLGSGARMGNDRDRDSHRDGDELDAGSDPGNPGSVPGPTGCTTAVERSVASGADDAEQTAAGVVDLASGDLDPGQLIVGMRFTGIDIPPGATITNAYIQFKADEAQSGVTALTIQAQAADSAAIFTTTTQDLSSRPRTSAAVVWSPPPWNVVGAAGPDQRTPDLKAVIQELVNRPGWARRSLAVIITGPGHRTAESYEGTVAGAPHLHVDYACIPTTDVGDAGVEFARLGLVFPNPGTGPATIRFDLARADDVQLEVYDIRGALVRRIASGRREAGHYAETWDRRDGTGRRLAKGMYMIRFSATGHHETRKLIILD
jgi:YVTN family beta-propeller protein